MTCARSASARRVEESDEEPEPTPSDVVKRVRGAIATRRAAASFNMGEALAATVEEQRERVLNRSGQFPPGTAFFTDQ